MMLWLKAFHVVFVVTWFSALFYLPRLFVYHAMSEDEISNARFKIMERKLFWGIMTPSAVIVALLGHFMIALEPARYEHATWLYIKLVLVFFLWVYHGACYYYLRQFARDMNRRSHVFYRWFNEVPVIFLIAIVCLAIVK